MLNRFIFSYYYFVWTELMFVYRLLNRRMYSRIRRNSIHTGKSNGRNQCESMAHKTGANLYIYTVAYTWTKSIQLNFNWNTCHPSRCKVNPFLFSRYLIICLRPMSIFSYSTFIKAFGFVSKHSLHITTFTYILFMIYPIEYLPFACLDN